MNKDQTLELWFSWVKYDTSKLLTKKRKNTEVIEIEYITQDSTAVTNLASQVTPIKHTRPRGGHIIRTLPDSSHRPRSLRVTCLSVTVIKLDLI